MKNQKTPTKQTDNKRTMADVKVQWQQFMSDNKKGLNGQGIDPNLMSILGYAYTNSPYIQNQRVKKVQSQPFTENREAIEKSLADIPNSEQSLRQVGASLYSNYPLLKLNTMYSNILSYRYYFNSKYASPKDMSTKEYKTERRLISNWLDKFQPKRTFQKIVESVQWEGKVAYYMRDSLNEKTKTFDYAYLQQLPSDYIKIVGWNTDSEFTIMFDFTYFWTPGTSPKQFPPIFEKYYEELNLVVPESQRKKRPNPNAMANLKLDPSTEFYYKDNKWFYWRTLPMDECFVFSQTESNAYQVPNTAGLFLQAKDLQDYQYLQQELIQLPLSGVICSTLPMAKDSNGTIATDNYGIGTEAFTFFTDMFNSAAPKGVQMFMSPATNPQFFKFDGDIVNNSQVVTNALQQFNAVAGVGGLNSTTDKPNIMQVKTQQTLEAAYSARMYEQFQNFVNVWWNKKLNLNYIWRFHIKGDKFSDTVEYSNVKELVSLGQNYMMPELLSFYGLDIDDARALQEDVKNSELYANLQVVQSAYNQSKQTRVDIDTVDEYKTIAEGFKTGRPAASIENVESDGTANSIGTGTNTADGRVVMSLTHCVECGKFIDNNKTNKYRPFCSEECAFENMERLGVEHNGL